MREAVEETITVLIADHQALSRAGVRALLASAEDIEIVGEAQDAGETQGLIAALRPCILLLEMEIPGLRPVRFQKWLREHYPGTSTLILAAHDHDAHLAMMMDAGIAGYLYKMESEPKLIDSIRRVAKGEILFDIEQLAKARLWKEEVGNKLDGLTTQEHNTLRLLMKGHDNKTIAGELQVSVKTVSYHITNLLRKLGLKNRQEAAIWGLKHLSDDLDKFPG